jgi:MoxR-like ATPase
VLLIDEIDKTDQEFEAMLLELLSRLPDLDPRARPLQGPHAADRAAHLEQHARAHGGAEAPLPVPVARLPRARARAQIVKLHTPELDDAIARKLVEVVAMVRELDLKKPPSIAESVDWARALLLLGADDIDQEVFTQTLSIIVKHRTDLDVVTERVGMKLPVRAASAGQS